MIKKISLITLLVSLLFGSIWQINHLSAETDVLPAGFNIVEVASGLRFPTGMVILPNDDIMVISKGGNPNIPTPIKLIVNGVTQQTPVLELFTNSIVDSGLLAIVLDPDFASNRWFYIYYATAPKSQYYSGLTELRLSRFTYNPATKTADIKLRSV